ncbi:biotin/lipoyl-binding protein, partial [Variovorax sp. CT11-76]
MVVLVVVAAVAGASRPVLTVTIGQPEATELAVTLAANGNVAAWQEASVGSESNGLRLAEVRVNVGDAVKKGQVLATFSPETVQADIAQAKASLAEARAT